MAPLRLAERNQELLRTFCPQLYEQASVVATQADWLSASHMRTLMEMCRPFMGIDLPLPVDYEMRPPSIP